MNIVYRYKGISRTGSLNLTSRNVTDPQTKSETQSSGALTVPFRRGIAVGEYVSINGFSYRVLSVRTSGDEIFTVYDLIREERGERVI